MNTKQQFYRQYNSSRENYFFNMTIMCNVLMEKCEITGEMAVP